MFHNEPIYGPKMDEVIGEWRKLHNEELNDLHCSPIWVIKKEECNGRGMQHVWGERTGVYNVLVEKP